MPLLNYTTTVAAEKTLAEIQRILAKHGASSLLIDYANRQPATISFVAPTAHGDRGFRLPANIEAVFAVMTKQAREGHLPRRFLNREQAARVSWRIVKDWLEAQMAIIEAQMVTIDEVFLPYLLDEQTGRTIYQILSASAFKALPPGKSDDPSL